MVEVVKVVEEEVVFMEDGGGRGDDGVEMVE